MNQLSKTPLGLTALLHCKLVTLLLALLLTPQASAQEGEFNILSAKAWFDQSQLLVDAKLDLALTDEVEEAVHKGIPVTILVDLRLYKVRNRIIWDSKLATWEFPYQLQYHALTRHYLLKYPHSERIESYLTIGEAMEAMSQFTFHSEVIGETLPSSKRGYRLAMQVTLDLDSLPAPLRVMTSMLPSWWLESPWFEWHMPL